MDVVESFDNGYLVCGLSSYNTPDTLGWVVKLDNYGNQLWNYYDNNMLGYFDISLTNDNSYVIVGAAETGICISKFDIEGSLLWTKLYDDVFYPSNIQQTSDNGFVIIGGTYSKFDILKTDSQGNKLWSLSSSGIAPQGNYGHPTIDNGYIFYGSVIEGSSWKIIVIKTDDNLSSNTVWDENIEWVKTFSVDGSDANTSCGQQTIDGGYIVYGNASSVFGNNWLIKLDSNGNEEWSNFLTAIDFENNNIVDELLLSGFQTTDGGYILSGRIKDYGEPGINDTSYEVFLMKVDEFGNKDWVKKYGEHDYSCVGKEVKQTSDGGFLFIDASNENLFGTLIKTDSEGNLTTTELIYPNKDKNVIQTIDILGRSINDKTLIPLIDIYDDGSAIKRIIVD